MLGPKFTVEVETVDGTKTVFLSGELDMATVEALGAAFDEVSEQTLVVDMSEVTFIDSVGLGFFVSLKNDHPNLRLVTSPAVDRLLAVTQLREHFGLDP